MNRLLMTAAFPVVILIAAAASGDLTADEKDDGFKPLFNGKDLKGFKFLLKEEKADPAKTWIVTDGYIKCTGSPTGYFYTDKSYKNYLLSYDWRYPKGSKPTSNSGCLINIQEPHQIFPKCMEPQGRYQDHGKLFPIRLKKEEVMSNTFDAEALKKALKPMGEWSTTEIMCTDDGSITVKVNGVEVSTGQSVLTEGPIGWQSEGSEIHFRNIKIKGGK